MRAAIVAAAAVVAVACGGPGDDAPRVKLREPIVSTIVTGNLSTVRDLLFLDVDGDGRRDFVVAFRTGDGSRQGFMAYLGNGDGNFRQGGTFEPGFVGAVADFNGDGRVDLATCASDTVRLYLASATGLGAPAATTISPSGCEEIATADFNGDGRADLALAVRGPSPNAGLGAFFVLFSTAGGGWQRGELMAPNFSLEATSGWLRMFPADFDNDRRVDLLVTTFVNGGPYVPMVMRGHGDGSFNQVWPGGPLAEVFDARSVAAVGIADLDGDGRADVVMDLPGHFVPLPPRAPPPPRRSDTNLAMRGMGDGTFGAILWENNPGVAAGALADLDGDGRVDSVSWTVDAEKSQLRVAFGRGDGTFFDPVVLFTDPGRNTGRLAFADVNGDGRIDILSLSGDNPTLPSNAGVRLAVFLRE